MSILTGFNGLDLIVLLGFLAVLWWVTDVAWAKWMDSLSEPLPRATFDREAADRTVYGSGDFGTGDD